MFFKRLTAPTSSLLTLDEAKSYLELGDDDSEDTNLGLLKETAVADLEDFLRLPLLNQTWRLGYDRADVTRCTVEDGATVIPLPIENISAIARDSVKVYDLGHVESTLATADYQLVDGFTPTIFVSTDKLADLRMQTALTVSVTAGFGATATDVPSQYRRAALAIVAFDFENRGDRWQSQRLDLMTALSLNRRGTLEVV